MQWKEFTCYTTMKRRRSTKQITGCHRIRWVLSAVCFKASVPVREFAHLYTDHFIKNIFFVLQCRNLPLHHICHSFHLFLIHTFFFSKLIILSHLLQVVDREVDPEDDPNNQGEDEFEEAEDERPAHRVVEEEEEPPVPAKHINSRLRPAQPAVEEELVVSQETDKQTNKQNRRKRVRKQESLIISDSCARLSDGWKPRSAGGHTGWPVPGRGWGNRLVRNMAICRGQGWESGVRSTRIQRFQIYILLLRTIHLIN